MENLAKEKPEASVDRKPEKLLDIQFFEDEVIFYNTCPNCRENYPRAFYEDWPKQGYRQCGTCGKYFKREEFCLTAKLLEHPSQVLNVCPECESRSVRIMTKGNYDFIFFRVECFKCHRISWFAYKRHNSRLRTAKIANAKRNLSSYGEYRARFFTTTQGPIQSRKDNKNDDVVVPISRLVKQKFTQYYKTEPMSVGYTKKERSNYIFEKIIPYHPAVRIFENYKVVYEDILSTAHKLVPINKKGKLWDYLLLAVIHVVLYLQNKTEFMPDLPYFWKKTKTTSFHWKTYQKHLLFVISNTQPFIRDSQLLAKKPEAWLQQMILWYDSVPQPNNSVKLMRNISNAVSLDLLKKSLHQPNA